MSNTLYDRDFYAWANEQATLLRAGQFGRADIDNIAEEIECMGRSEKRELINRLIVLLQHLLQWQFQPGLRGNSWRLTIANQRLALEDHLQDNPSLKAQIDSAMHTAYRRAKGEAERETGLPPETFPATCPFSFDQVASAAFWPD